jgi:hypothetical protein
MKILRTWSEVKRCPKCASDVCIEPDDLVCLGTRVGDDIIYPTEVQFGAVCVICKHTIIVITKKIESMQVPQHWLEVAQSKLFHEAVK